MPAKDRRPDLLSDFAAHMEATRKAREWAEKSMAYRVAGENRQADAAESKAKHWLAKAMRLEGAHQTHPHLPRALKRTRRGGR